MTHHYRVVKCPHCSAKTDFTHTTKEQLVGSPVRTCSKCKKRYFDGAYMENAINYYLEECTTPDISEIVVNLFYTVLTGGAFYVFFAAALAGEHVMWILVLVFGFLFYGLARGTILKIYGKMNPEKHRQKALRHLENDGIYAESLSRLSDRKYLDYLKKMGAVVPEYFFKRLSNGPVEKNAVPQEAQVKQGDKESAPKKTELSQYRDVLDAWLASQKAKEHDGTQANKRQESAKDGQKEAVGYQEQSVPDQLRAFKALLDEGVITEEEFRRKKEQLLDL